MINRKYIRHSKQASIWKSVKIIIFAVIFFGIAVFTLITPGMLRAADYQGKLIVNQMLSDTISEVISSENIDYSSIVKIVRDKNHKITSIDTDIKTVNKIKSMMAKNIALKFNGAEQQSKLLPIGSLFSSPILVGRGPKISIEIIPIGYLNSQIKSEFFSGGINQTNHKISLDIMVDYTLILPLHSSKTTLETNFIIADTVIVGEVPEYYTNLAGENAKDYSNIKTVYPNDIQK